LVLGHTSQQTNIEQGTHRVVTLLKTLSDIIT
jgi:hypothetical protein